MPSRCALPLLLLIVAFSPTAGAQESETGSATEEEIPLIRVMERETWFPEVWSLRLAGGWSVDETLGEITGGSIRVEEDNAGIINLQIGRPIVEDYRDWPIDFVLKLGLERFFERGAQSDFWGHSISVKAYWKKFPWDRFVRTRFGFSEGMSYTWKIPNVERVEQRRKDRNTSRLLNYLDVSIDLNLGDIVRQKSLEGCWLGYSIWHRSGAFGFIDIYGSVSGGSNYNTGYIECTF